MELRLSWVECTQFVLVHVGCGSTHDSGRVSFRGRGGGAFTTFAPPNHNPGKFIFHSGRLNVFAQQKAQNFMLLH